jgi:hypothetical protein
MPSRNGVGTAPLLPHLGPPDDSMETTQPQVAVTLHELAIDEA